ncbi:HAD family hydrolase [Pseudonocardia sp. ICBG1034]|uniref:HAD family hydrolase n=1 Tax=Pseudonocardia sp. ICBG1034 TaxID=2844381 RepID=UPI001CC96FCC|nr:HAD family hydrolase [Pseudonocardia sp. ICBG1034]
MPPVLRAVAPPTAALLALLLPLAGPALAGAAWAPPCATAALLVALAVVATTGRAGLRVAVRGLREGTVTAETGVAAAVLAALGWSAAVLAVAAVSPAGADAVPADPLAGPVLLPGAAAVLTVVAAAVQRTGRPADGDADEVRAGLRTVADRWSALLTPPAALAAVAVTAFAAGTGTPWPVAVPAGIAVLVGACPVPLLAALPAALRAADRAGGDAVRLPSPLPGRREPVGWTGPAGGPGLVGRVDTVALAGPDVLTGTGPGTVTVHAGRGEDPALVLRLAASVAAGARPGSDLRVAARALADAVDGPVPDVAEADEHPGLGVSGLVAELREPGPGDGGATATVVAHAVLLGSPDWLAEHGIRVPPPLAVQRERAVAEGRAVLVVAWDGCARAVLALPRAPHPAARPGVAELAAAGVAPVLLTPDDDGAARALAAASGLDPADPDAVRPGLDAAARAAAVAGLRVRGRTVAVAADPATDGAALAAADLAVELVPWPTDDGAGPGSADGPDARPDPVVVPAPGSERICARGGPAEVAAALLIARRARAQVRAHVRAAVVLAVAGVVLAVLGTPAVVVAAVPVLGALGLAARGPRRRS